MRILDIFEKKTINQLKVLQNIYENEGIINIEKISKKTHLDSKTVATLVQDILGCVENNKDLSRTEDYIAVRSSLFQMSWVYKFFYRLFLAKEVSIISFTIEAYISESKLRRKVKLINDMLKSVELKITSRNGYVYIKGSETQIRFLGQQFFWTIFKGTEWPFKEVEFKKIYELFSEYIFSKTDTQIKTVTYVEWCYTFAINVIRFRHGKEIQEENLKTFYYLYSTEYNNRGYIQKIRDILKEDYHLSIEEQMYFFLLLQAKVQFYMNDTFFNRSIQLHQKNNTEIYVVYKEVLKYFMKNNKKASADKMALAVILSANTSAALIHGFSHTHSGYGIPRFFSKYAPHLIPKMEEVVNLIKKKYPTISFLNQSTYLSVRYAEAYALLNNMMDFEKKILVVLMTDLSLAAEELIIRQLNAIFSTKANVEFKALDSYEMSRYDLILKTTITIYDSEKNNEKVVIINPDLCDKDIQNINQRIKEISKKRTCSKITD